MNILDCTSQELKLMAKAVIDSIPQEDWGIPSTRKDDLIKLEAGVAVIADLYGFQRPEWAICLAASVEAAYLLGRRDGKSAGVLQFQVAEES